MSAPARIWAWTAPALVIPVFAAWFYFIERPGGAGVAAALYAAAKVFTVVFPWVGGLALRSVSSRGPQPPWRGEIVSGLAWGAIMGGIVGAVGFTPLGERALAAAPDIRDRIGPLGGVDYYVPFAVFLAGAHSLIEEVYWRRWVYGNLRALLRPAPAAGLAALGFSAHHAVILGAYFPARLAILGWMGVLAAGLFWCRLYDRRGSLVAPWISHLLVDAAILALGYRILFLQ